MPGSVDEIFSSNWFPYALALVYAGLLMGLARKMDLESAGRLANRTAADSCTKLSGTAGIEDLASTLRRAGLA